MAQKSTPNSVKAFLCEAVVEYFLAKWCIENGT